MNAIRSAMRLVSILVLLAAAAATTCAQEIDHWALAKIFCGPGRNSEDRIKFEFVKADGSGGEVQISNKCFHDSPHWRHHVFTWKFQGDARRFTKDGEQFVLVEGKRDDSNLAVCPLHSWPLSASFTQLGPVGWETPRDTALMDIPHWNAKDTSQLGGETYAAGDYEDPYDRPHTHSMRVGYPGFSGQLFNLSFGDSVGTVYATYYYSAVHRGEEDPKIIGEIPGGGQGNDGKKPSQQGNPWDDPTVQRAIDEWLQRSHPGSPPHGSWTQWGQAIGDGVSAPSPPDHDGMGRYEYLWRHASELHSADMGTLAEYLAGKGSKGGGGGPSGGQVLPTPPPGSPEPAPGVSRTTLQAGVRVVKQGETVQLPVYLVNAADLSNMNFEVSFDASVVRMSIQPERGDLLGDKLFDANAAPAGPVKIGFAGSGGVSGTGAVALLTFLATGAPGGQTAISLKITTANETGGKVPTIDIIHGSIQIPPEDTFDALDASKALAMSVGNLPVDLRLDLDKDGEVTSRDATLILQKVMPRQGR